MQVDFYPYEIYPRKGALLRFKLLEDIYYGDIFPWPEFGDLTLDQYLECIKENHATALFSRALYLGQNFPLKSNIKKDTSNNHFIIQDLKKITRQKVEEICEKKFESVKIKMSTNLDENLLVLDLFSDYPLNLRLDFNSKLRPQEALNYIKNLSSKIIDKIEFIEDITSYDENIWKIFSDQVPLALDFEYENWKKSFKDGHVDEEVPFKVIILKPARQDTDKIIEETIKYNLSYIVTSVMDSVLGELQAQKYSESLQKRLKNHLLTSGCSTRHLYQDSEIFHILDFESLEWRSLA